MIQEYLLQRCAEMEIPLTQTQAAQLEEYHCMLVDANTKMNLTRVSDDWQEAADRNYLDSLAPAKYIPDGVGTLVDVGTGAGFPGVPLSILRPDIRVTLMDSLGKRVEFLQGVIKALGLNASAVHIRAEDAGRKPEYRDAFDMAASRAVASMNVLCEFCLPLVREGGILMALKGPGLDDEMAEAANAMRELNAEHEASHLLTIPGRDWDHRAAIVRKIAPTPEKYPRRPGMAEKKPIR